MSESLSELVCNSSQQVNKNRTSKLTMKLFVYYISTEILKMLVTLNHYQLTTKDKEVVNLILLLFRPSQCYQDT